MSQSVASARIPPDAKVLPVLKVSKKLTLIAVLSFLFLVQPAFSAPFGNGLFPLRLPIVGPLRLIERMRENRIPFRPEPRMVELAGLKWHADYNRAWKQAKTERKLLLVLFHTDKPSGHRQAVLNLIAKDAAVAKKLKGDFVLASVPMDQKIVDGGQRKNLISHGSMHEMHGYDGLAIVDLKHVGRPYYGYVVSSYPFMNGKYYHFRATDLPVIINLPPGTITQRTMVWAVRVHPERPASTTGNASAVLTRAAESHSHYQAQIGVQGHHHWESRFQRINGQLQGVAPVEVVAESWPNQTMIDSCVDCVASWRQSAGHWNAVKSRQGIYGSEIKRGTNGMWYGTGIIAR
jgi:hypothetical protein